MLILALTGCIAAGCGTITDRIRFGAAGLGGMYHAFADTFSDIAQSDEDYKMEVKTTAGSAANLRLLSDDYVQLAIAQADITNDAYYGTGIFEGKEYQGYSA
ncbi:C4-dicarboxylate ABC transporter substrate-binding protein, partial [Sphingobium sp. D43FB]